MEVYLSVDGVIETTDLLLGTVSIGGLAGSSSTSSATPTNVWQLPVAGTPFWQGDGTYTVGIIVDSGNDLFEADETNNSNQGDPLDLTTVAITSTEAVPGDLDGDRQADILWRNESNGRQRSLADERHDDQFPGRTRHSDRS